MFPGHRRDTRVSTGESNGNSTAKLSFLELDIHVIPTFAFNLALRFFPTASRCNRLSARVITCMRIFSSTNTIPTLTMLHECVNIDETTSKAVSIVFPSPAPFPFHPFALNPPIVITSRDTHHVEFVDRTTRYKYQTITMQTR